MIAVWDQRSQDHCASDEYGRFIVPPGEDDAHVIEGETLSALGQAIDERLARYEAETRRYPAVIGLRDQSEYGNRALQRLRRGR